MSVGVSESETTAAELAGEAGSWGATEGLFIGVEVKVKKRQEKNPVGMTASFLDGVVEKR